MHVMHGDKTYDADFVVHPNCRSKNINPKDIPEAEKNYPHGLAQALCVKVYEDMLIKHPKLAGSWFIAGGYGGQSVGAHLYDIVFPSAVLNGNTQLQNDIGLFLIFGSPGQELLLAANRDSQTKCVNNDENTYVKEALDILAQSKEPNLAAQQPNVETKKEKEVISPLSIFTEKDKTPDLIQNAALSSLRPSTGY